MSGHTWNYLCYFMCAFLPHNYTYLADISDTFSFFFANIWKKFARGGETEEQLRGAAEKEK